METLVRDISVDAGMIIISDKGLLPSLGGTLDQRLAKFIDMENGIYNVRWSIRNSWNGNISGSGTVDVTSGGLFIGDPCYHFHDDSNDLWSKVLKETDYFESEDKWILCSTGGDGGFDMRVSWKQKL